VHRLAALLHGLALLPVLAAPLAPGSTVPWSAGAIPGPGLAWWLLAAWGAAHLRLGRGSRTGRWLTAPAFALTGLLLYLSGAPAGSAFAFLGGAPLTAADAGLLAGLLAVLAGTVVDATAALRTRRATAPDLRAFYERAVAARRIQRDPEQERVVDRLQELGRAFVAYRRSPRSVLDPFGHRRPRGVYLWGPVGRGKSFLADGFFDALAVPEKRRWHFHELMRDLRRRLHELTGTPNAVARAVDESVLPRSLVYVDEVHLADVDNARVFGQVLLALRRRGCVVCMTSNYAPEALATAGAGAAEPFREVLAFVEGELDVLELDNRKDYRSLKLTARDLYQDAADPGTAKRMAALFELLAEGPPSETPLTLSNRPVPVVRRAEGIAWFHWRDLCEGPRSYLDFLELAHGSHTVLVQDVPALDESREDAARRLAWLVEVLYDQRKRLILSARVPVDGLFAGPFSGSARASEFARVASRLKEMQSTEYDLHLATAVD
jgi:cell division protein ZapE